MHNSKKSELGSSRRAILSRARIFNKVIIEWIQCQTIYRLYWTFLFTLTCLAIPFSPPPWRQTACPDQTSYCANPARFITIVIVEMYSWKTIYAQSFLKSLMFLRHVEACWDGLVVGVTKVLCCGPGNKEAAPVQREREDVRCGDTGLATERRGWY